MTRLTLKACAKINLYLKLVGRRPDGFHDIESVVQTVTLGDRVVLDAADDGISLSVDDEAVPADATNLAWRAAAGLPAPGTGPRGVRIRLDKRIPAGAGLGGGSADAAAALVGTARLRGLDLTPADLMERALALGSDVPFFLVGGTALLEGRGERVTPLPDLLGYGLLIVWPRVPIATAEVYRAASASLTSVRKISRMARFDPIQSRTIPERVEEWVGVGNALEPYARALCPAIGDIQERLRDAGATAAAMTGSGSAVFGVFRDGGVLATAASAMEQRGFRAMRCAPLGRQDYREGLGLA
jgi:4-diphosphocytidyl-2-C-methyl-D-erythritol kinase